MGSEKSKARLGPLLLKGLWTALVICTPLLGVWLSASLAAYLNGPLWAIWLVGFMLFPGGPLLWEGLGHLRRTLKARKGGKPGKRFLTWYDRFILRTLAVNIVFLVVMLWAYPQEGFAALATRGDWMLMDSEAPWTAPVRRRVFATAEGLAWLYEATQDDPFEEFQPDEGDDEVTPKPAPTAKRTWVPLPKPPASGDGATPQPPSEPPPSSDPQPSSEPQPPSEPQPTDEPAPPTPKPSPEATPEPDAQPDLASQPWPVAAELHPLVRQIPASEETSIASIARWIAAREKRPFHRVKALHDYVADRIAYDVPALSLPRIPSQAPAKVLAERKGVCAGYALLMAALGKVTGDRILYVGGDARDLGGNVGGGGHAWNAVEIAGHWYLLDATWDAGSVTGDGFTKRYSTDYLFTPPDIFISDHIPDDDKWQLLSKPLSRGAFMRQPVLRPSFFAQGLRLTEPTRSQVSVGDAAKLTIANPQQRFLLARLRRKGVEEKGARCQVTKGTTTQVHCAVPKPGTYQVWLFAALEQYGNYPFVGQLEVNRR